MPLWGRNDADANTAPKYKIEAGTTMTGITSFGNTTVQNGRAIGTFGVDKTEAQVSDFVAHAGWVVVRQGTGFVDSVTVIEGGTGYVNGDVVVVSGGTSNAAGVVVTDEDGVVEAVTLSDKGRGFIDADSATVAVTSDLGDGATFGVVMGGRAGRKQAEVMVAMSTITGDASDDDLFPDS